MLNLFCFHSVCLGIILSFQPVLNHTLIVSQKKKKTLLGRELEVVEAEVEPCNAREERQPSSL